MAISDEIPPSESPPQTGIASINRSRASSSASGPSRARAGSNASAGGRSRATSGASGGRLRSGSLRFLESNPGSGWWQATTERASQAPTFGEIRRGSYSTSGWTEEGQLEARGNTPHDVVGLQQRRLSRINSGLTRTNTSNLSPTSPPLTESQEEHEYGFPSIATRVTQESGLEDIREVPPPTIEKQEAEVFEATAPSSSSLSASADQPTLSQKHEIMATEHGTNETDESATYPNGYRFPPKHTWKETTAIGAKALWKFTWTPFGFFVVLYALNVVAWGAMIFFVLLNAAPAMCHPSCNDDSSARKKWIEYDSQILNALFCVTGFGLIPWRFRDFYFLMQFRLFKNINGLRKLAGINRSWFRLPGSQDLEEHFGPPPNPKAKPIPEGESPPEYPPPPPYTEEEIESMVDNNAIPLPVYSAPPAPLTGNRARPTKIWKLDLVIWLYIWNTIFQACLCGFLWGYNRYNRPAWGTALFIVLAFSVGIAAGLVVFVEGKAVKKVEGVPISDADRMKMLMLDEEARGADQLATKENNGVFKQDWDSNGKAMK